MARTATRSKARRRKSPIVRNMALLLLLAGGGAAAWYYFNPPEANAEKPVWRTVQVKRSSVASTVSASGSLKAVVTVEVGSQISGQVKAIYADFNGRVKQGQAIALIDPDSFRAKVAESKADLAVAEANVSMHEARGQTMQADIRAAEAALKDAQAAVLQMNSNIASRSEIVGERGYDIEQLDREIADDTARAKRLGISPVETPQLPAKHIIEDEGLSADEPNQGVQE